MRSNSKKILLITSYNGSNFYGWQIQNDVRTVQGVIQDTLKKILGYSVKLVGSGRTDAGVHADYQPAHFIVEDCPIPTEKFLVILNGKLPNDIRIIEVKEVNKDFHSRFSARERIYRYYIFNGNFLPPRMNNFVFEIKKDFDIDRLNQFASIFEGEHNFISFCAGKDESSSKVRTINYCRFFLENGFIVFEISGNAFLWNMVRLILGTIIEQYENKNGINNIKNMLKSDNRVKVGKIVPPNALTLYRVNYE